MLLEKSSLWLPNPVGKSSENPRKKCEHQDLNLGGRPKWAGPRTFAPTLLSCWAVSHGIAKIMIFLFWKKYTITTKFSKTNLPPSWLMGKPPWATVVACATVSNRCGPWLLGKVRFQKNHNFFV
jgi:hypothetical protein